MPLSPFYMLKKGDGPGNERTGEQGRETEPERESPKKRFSLLIFFFYYCGLTLCENVFS